MYATEKYVKMEARELQSSINQVAADLGSDIQYLHSEIEQLKLVITELQIIIQSYRDKNE